MLAAVTEERNTLKEEFERIKTEQISHLRSHQEEVERLTREREKEIEQLQQRLQDCCQHEGFIASLKREIDELKERLTMDVRNETARASAAENECEDT